ncbi:PD-(D/E)XK nuclease family protein [Aestuariivivens sp. NBU2969]|uniref:PD-(D/E)XK nuclease family protein n=1 Tax=Aestuariivivens sp. NBU2969 TaxID=2873267 RepID=UPI001CBB576B|nr:PD-(D/E)XK nuclease family protein [Aestuariivivens sp. NBU2969]
MRTFIFDVLTDLKEKQTNLTETTFILPSKRAGLFLKHQLHKFINRPIFSPIILSIEEFVEDLSALKKIPNTELLFLFYNSYKQLTPKEDLESFESFTKWGQLLLQDFNEIDRYLIPQEKIFNYLSAIKEVEHQHWSLETPQTDFIKKYLSFWNKLNSYYNDFTQSMLDENSGYQGLMYRKAVENLNAYIQNNGNKSHVFLGFNALNTAEKKIIEELLEHNLAQIYWDIDATFIENRIHDAGFFTRQHKTKWNYFSHQPFNWITSHYSKPKNISIYGIPKQVGQAKYIGNILKDLQEENPSFQNTAIVLGDENLLIPVLNSLPKNIGALNITMGLPLKSVPLASLFQTLLEIHKKDSKTFYFKDLIKILSHQFIRPLFIVEGVDHALSIINTINNTNLVYVTLTKLKEMVTECHELLDILFLDWDTSIEQVIENCTALILLLKTHLDKNKSSNLLALEYLFRFNTLFNELSRLNTTYHHIKDVSALYGVYKEILASETLDFQGEPLQGLQIMGMLESRVLDFETVIISSVNEGLLPAGKSNNSFIPFDVKLENNLPTFKEKDAVYTYHFYRLLQRAKNVYILYNTEADVLVGGEKSRFITQLEIENIHNINHNIIAPEVPIIKSLPNSIQKTSDVITTLKSIAEKGFSPSSLTNYIRNPIDFYYEKVLGIKELEDVEETVAANTLGTVVHNTLEAFYKPLEGQFLTPEIIKAHKSNISKTVTLHFKKEYKAGDITKGKNLIIFEIAKRYVANFLDLELKQLEAGNTIKILAIEVNNVVPINIPELGFPINLTGKVDRVDEYNGMVRLIDYKTGNVQQNQVEIVDWEDLTTDYTKYSKSFQVLTYSYMMSQSNHIKLPIEAGIISFKNLNSGFIKFTKKDKAGYGARKEALITQETLSHFETELKKLIVEICNPTIDFVEKEV